MLIPPPQERIPALAARESAALFARIQPLEGGPRGRGRLNASGAHFTDPAIPSVKNFCSAKKITIVGIVHRSTASISAP